MSETPSLPLERQLVSILAANREDSFATQRKRSTILSATARHIVDRFGLQKWDNLKQKHVSAVIVNWKAADHGCRSIEEKLTHMRWLLQKIGKPNLLPRTNRELGVEPGPRYTRAGNIVSEDRYQQLVSSMHDPRVQAMLLLARELGLRFKEASLLRPWRDWDGKRVWIKRGSKGGRPRYLYLHNPRQVAALQVARALTSRDQCLIPAHFRTYEQWRQAVYRELRQAGLSRAGNQTFHDLRRTYVHERMQFLVKDCRLEHQRAAALVAREVGHARIEVLDWYVSA